RHSLPLLMRFLLALTIFLQAAAPQPAPALSLKDTKGRTILLSNYKGKVVLVNFGATWCAPCLAEMPELQRLQQEYQKRGLQIVGISHPIDNAGRSSSRTEAGRRASRHRLEYTADPVNGSGILLRSTTWWRRDKGGQFQWFAARLHQRGRVCGCGCHFGECSTV